MSPEAWLNFTRDVMMSFFKATIYSRLVYTPGLASLYRGFSSFGSISPIQKDWDEHRQPETWLTRFETGERLGIFKLDNRVFSYSPRLDILQRVVIWQLAKKRAGTAKVKTRGEVRGGGRKPWQQKGSGRARQGSIRAPHWKGGGVVHGPRGNTDYSYTLPRKVKALGLCTALSIKYAQNDLLVVDDLTVNNNSTKNLLRILDIHGLRSVLLVDGGDSVNMSIALSGGNIPHVDLLPITGINVVNILSRDKLVLTLGAVRMIEDRLCNLLY